MELRWKRLEGEDGHSAALSLLAQMLSPLPEIRKTPQGKPYFVDSDWHFSVSHTKNHVFCAISRKNIGIDAEEMGRSVKPSLMESMTSPAEKRRLSALADPADGFLRLWVQKEAYAKLTGRGIGSYLKETDLSPEQVLRIDGCYVAVREE